MSSSSIPYRLDFGQYRWCKEDSYRRPKSMEIRGVRRTHLFESTKSIAIGVKNGPRKALGPVKHYSHAQRQGNWTTARLPAHDSVPNHPGTLIGSASKSVVQPPVTSPVTFRHQPIR